jgi:hypothetical protein
MNLIRPRSIRKPVTDELVGGIAGYHVEHWNDAQDAKITVGRHISVHIPPNGLLLGDGLLLPADPEPPKASMHQGRMVPVIAGGAWSVSGLYVLNWIDILDATQLAIDTSLNTHKIAMYNNTETPNYSTETAYSATNEVSGAGYTAGGQTILSPTTTESPSGTLMYDMADQVWASPTTVTAFGAKLYADVLAGNNLIVGVNFAGSFTSTAGTFTIQWASTGVFTIDLTP